MAVQEESKSNETTQETSIWKSTEARVIMFIVPAIAILTLIAYLVKQ